MNHDNRNYINTDGPWCCILKLKFLDFIRHVKVKFNKDYVRDKWDSTTCHDSLKIIKHNWRKRNHCQSQFTTYITCEAEWWYVTASLQELELQDGPLKLS